jgi:hypothetical protein
VTDDQKRGHLGKFFVALLNKIDVHVILDDIRWLQYDLREADGFADLVLKIMANPNVSEYRQEDILEVLNDLPCDTIQAHTSQLEFIATNPNVPRSLPANLVETLTRVGAWEEAARINHALYSRIEDTTEKCAQKLEANLHRIAAAYEAAIAKGNMSALSALAQEWQVTEQQIKTHESSYAKRFDPFKDLPGAY